MNDGPGTRDGAFVVGTPTGLGRERDAMNHPLAYTRREFIHHGMAMMSTVATVPAFVQRSACAAAPVNDAAPVRNRPGVPEDRILVVIQLSGGNDGLNTVVPYEDDIYYRVRPTLALPAGEVLPLSKGSGLALHPRMSAMRELFDEGLMTIVQGVGYPNPNRSHFVSMDIWHAGDTRGNRGVGWLGKALDDVAPKTRNAFISVGHDAPLVGHGTQTTPVSFDRPEIFRWIGSDLYDALEDPYQRISREQFGGVAAKDDDQAAFVRRTALDAQVASEQVRLAVERGPVTKFPNGELSEQLSTVAAMIRSGLPTRVYYVGLGRFDNHAGQAGVHGGQLEQFSVAVRAFQQALKATGDDRRVLTVAFSEFGRRVAENASRGTDHGAAGPMFLFGPMVRPGVVGASPALAEVDERGDLKYGVDFRAVYAAVLGGWMKADSSRVLGQRFRPATVLNERFG